MFAAQSQLEILDLRHFSSPALRPLLQEEAAKWERRLQWDYSRSIELLLEYIDSRSLTGYVAVQRGRVAGYTFGVCEAAKAVLGDVYAFSEGEQESNPVCDVLLQHLIETLQATPGIERIESQLLLFPEGALRTPLLGSGFRPSPRCFMVRDFDRQPDDCKPALPATSRMERWQPEAYLATASLIHEAYIGHMDSGINDQYQSITGAQRFLHNIVHFPGCGVFDARHSWLLRDRATGELQGVILCSRVRNNAAHITQLCLRSRLRNEGLGGALLGHCLSALRHDGLRSVSLTVTAANTAALRLYERHGFTTQQRFDAWVWHKARL